MEVEPYFVDFLRDAPEATGKKLIMKHSVLRLKEGISFKKDIH